MILVITQYKGKTGKNLIFQKDIRNFGKFINRIIKTDCLVSTSGWYETLFRNYDPAIGRFTAVDPKATTYASFSAYHYAFNNPVMFNDPLGADPDPVGYYGNGAGWNPYTSGQYTWVDYMIQQGDYEAYARLGMGHIYQDQQETASYLNYLAQKRNNNGYFLTPAGDWVYAKEVLAVNNPNQNPLWRSLAQKALATLTFFALGQNPNSHPRYDNFEFISEEYEFWAYKQMLMDQRFHGREIAAYYVTKKGTNERGILILPWINNGPDGSDPYVGMSEANKTITDWDGNVYEPFQALHTHPHYVQPSGKDGDIGGLTYLNKFFPGMNGVIISDVYYNHINSNGTSISHGMNFDLIKGTQSMFPKQ